MNTIAAGGDPRGGTANCCPAGATRSLADVRRVDLPLIASLAACHEFAVFTTKVRDPGLDTPFAVT